MNDGFLTAYQMDGINLTRISFVISVVGPRTKCKPIVGNKFIWRLFVLEPEERINAWKGGDAGIQIYTF